MGSAVSLGEHWGHEPNIPKMKGRMLRGGAPFSSPSAVVFKWRLGRGNHHVSGVTVVLGPIVLA